MLWLKPVFLIKCCTTLSRIDRLSLTKNCLIPSVIALFAQFCRRHENLDLKACATWLISLRYV